MKSGRYSRRSTHPVHLMPPTSLLEDVSRGDCAGISLGGIQHCLSSVRVSPPRRRHSCRSVTNRWEYFLEKVEVKSATLATLKCFYLAPPLPPSFDKEHSYPASRFSVEPRSLLSYPLNTATLRSSQGPDVFLFRRPRRPEDPRPRAR